MSDGLRQARNSEEEERKCILYLKSVQFKKVGRHLCPFIIKCWDVYLMTIKSTVYIQIFSSLRQPFDGKKDHIYYFFQLLAPSYTPPLYLSKMLTDILLLYGILTKLQCKLVISPAGIRTTINMIYIATSYPLSYEWHIVTVGDK